MNGEEPKWAHGRMGTPSELTGAVVLRASPAGFYMKGTDISDDGGATIF
jgi:hypothetical protein